MRREPSNISHTALHLTSEGTQKRGRPKNTWRWTVEGSSRPFITPGGPFRSWLRTDWSGVPLLLPYMAAAITGMCEWVSCLMFEDCPWAFENYHFALQFSNHVLRHSWYATGRQQISFDLHQKLVAVWRVFCLLMTFPAYKKVFTEATKRFINTKKGIYALCFQGWV